MNEPTWTDILAAWSTFGTAVLTAVLVILAVCAWRTAKDTLDASKKASEAAEASAVAAQAANEQARLDSIEQTRPYVFVEVVPGLQGAGCWDVRIANSGRSAARNLTLDYEHWSQNPDDVGTAVRELFETSRALPPGCSIRAVWRLEGNFTEGPSIVGLGKSGKITVRYTSDDPSRPDYDDSFDVMIEKSGLWPIPESGPEPEGVTGQARKFYRLGQALTRRIGETSR
ncbi:hypothetical protein [Microlunatus speluncae]|uniref:hypothetical protein n=1 Tax=Microlunatus speluncae TaxID=2594267 RepID=UPI001C2CE7A9|nr:hypothetical protein [Microlunatus speluncae]